MIPVPSRLFTLMEYSTLMRPQLEMVGVTAGILRGSASQRSSSAPAVMARPASEANLDLRTRVLPPAEKVCVWQSTASGTTRRLERLEKDASSRTNSPEGGKGQHVVANSISECISRSSVHLPGQYPFLSALTLMETSPAVHTPQQIVLSASA